ncbi:alpha/beta fold hydrolase [Streptomyces sp. LP11]|uniref:Alpha/beta fold hydrolase n=1 Tax=Streptomyces pyxinicus TaxID=2970331 RepID=A0ABT2AWB4_9ACTN|nr:alpha/beta fold hydrolase [Streptomyces sp. LP11]MCS0600553.1 alpha/beta fold hydrolase [Streptomyces sp. LP11]
MNPGGLNDWEIMKRTPEAKNVALRKVADRVSGKKTTLALHGARAAVSVGMLLPGNSRWRGVGSLFLSGTSCLLQARHRYGTDGSDQVANLVQSVTGIARLAKNPQTQDALLWYIGVQASMSYGVSGWVKLVGDKWRDGTALPGVMRTRTYGSEPIYCLTQRHPKASRAVQHATLAMECLFPLVYVAGGRLTRPFLAAAGGFHVANAFVMGLGRFMTAFPAMHPMVAYTTAPKAHPAVTGRDDRAARAAALLLAVGVAASVAVAAQRRAVVLEGWPTSRKLVTRHGNELMYETGGPDSDAPVLVFCAGLASTSEHFAWITERFAHGSEHAVVSYARAGYAGSRRNTKAVYELAESVDDLEDLVRAVVPENRKVVLVGHSLGGELIRRLAQRIPGRLAGLVYLDPSHPAELQRSDRQRAGAKDLRVTLTHVARYTRLGTGVLMSRPGWVDRLPAAYREKVFAQYTDARLWTAGKREWLAVEKEFTEFTGAVEPLTTPALIIAAQQTVDQDPEQLLLYNELARAHRSHGGRAAVEVIEGADHDSMLTEARYAHEAAQLMAEFLAAAERRSEEADTVAAHEGGAER